MTPRTRAILGVLVILAVAGALLWISQSSAMPRGRLVVAGDVRSDVRTINAPVIAYPTPNYAVGLPATSTAGGTPSATKRTVGAGGASKSVSVAGLLTSVPVREGDTVKAGEVVAQLDTRMLKLGVEAAKADAARTKTSVRLMNDALDNIADAKGKLRDARAQAFSMAYAQIGAGIAKAKAPIYAKHAEAVKGRPQLVAGIAQVEGLLSMLPPTSPQVPVLKEQLKQMKAQLAGIDAFLKQWPKIKRTFAKAEADAKAKAGAAINSKIGSAQAKIRDAEQQVKDARAVLRILADNTHIGVDLARAKVGQATIRTPVGGVVTFARRAGTVALVGAPLVRVRTEGPRLIDTYLTAEQLAGVPVGSATDITYDSAPGTVVRGTVKTIAASYLYPPTSFPTPVVHMTRTVKVTISVDDGASLPEGTPVDISIKTTATN